MAATELCEKIKDKILIELFEFIEENENPKIPEGLFIKNNEQNIFGKKERLELINKIISITLRELKIKEEIERSKELKDLEHLYKINSKKEKENKKLIETSIKKKSIGKYFK